MESTVHIHKITFYIITPICIFFLCLSALFEFLLPNIQHSSFYVNLSLGIFASSLLVVITALASYFVEKKRYYKTIFHDLSDAIILEIFLIEETHKKNKELHSSKVIQEIQSTMINVRANIMDFSFLCKRNHKDEVIDKSIDCTMRISMMFNFLLEQSNKLESEEITMEDYTYAYNEISSEFVHVYLPKLRELQDMIGHEMKKLVKDRVLQSSFEAKQ